MQKRWEFEKKKKKSAILNPLKSVGITISQNL